MTQTIGLLILLFSLTSCTYRVSLSESEVLAREFFNGRVPPQVTIPLGLKGSPDGTYKVRKLTLTSNNKNLKIFYTVSSKGRLGNMYVDGFNLNTVDPSGVVALTREQYLRKLIACEEDLECVVKAMGELEKDCRANRNSEHCWYCKQFSGPDGDGCSWL